MYKRILRRRETRARRLLVGQVGGYVQVISAQRAGRKDLRFKLG